MSEEETAEYSPYEIEVKGNHYLIKKEAVHFDLGDFPTPDGKVNNPPLHRETQENHPPLLPR